MTPGQQGDQGDVKHLGSSKGISCPAVGVMASGMSERSVDIDMTMQLQQYVVDANARRNKTISLMELLCPDESTPKATVLSAQFETKRPEFVYFLLRLLPYGELGDAAKPGQGAGDLDRLALESFCVKTYRDFEELARKLRSRKVEAERGEFAGKAAVGRVSTGGGSIDADTTWETSQSAIMVVPELPGSVEEPRGLWDRLWRRRTARPSLAADVQEFLDNLLSQLPRVDQEPIVKEFFEKGSVALSYPLVQEALEARGGEFPDMV